MLQSVETKNILEWISTVDCSIVEKNVLLINLKKKKFLYCKSFLR